MTPRIIVFALAAALLGVAAAGCNDLSSAISDADVTSTADPTVATADQSPTIPSVPVTTEGGSEDVGQGSFESDSDTENDDAGAYDDPSAGDHDPAGAAVTLSEEEAEGLIFMREEEKLARDVYLTLFDVWGLQIFENIAAAESRHTASVLDLIDQYGLDDPVVDDSIGAFTNPDLDAARR